MRCFAPLWVALILAVPAAGLDFDLGSFFGRGGDDVPKAAPVSGGPVEEACAGDKRPEPSGRAELENFILDGIQREGVSDSAHDEARRILRSLVSRLPSEVLANLYKNKVSLIIVPEGVKPTDMPQAAKLKKQIEEGIFTGTRDTRKLDELKNFADIPLPCGGSGWFLYEPNILGRELKGARQGYVTVHEFSHMVQYHGFTPEQENLVRAVYEGYRAAHFIEPRPRDRNLYWPFPDGYAGRPKEFFAQLSNVWLDAYQYGPQRREHKTPSWFDFSPDWLPAGPEFTSQENWAPKGEEKETFSGSLDHILGESRKHERMQEFLGSIWGPRGSVL